MKISLTQRHINKGRRKGCHTCPIALAVIEALGRRRGTRSVHVETLRVRIRKGPEPWHWIALPERVKWFIYRFDAVLVPRKEFQPFEFDLDIPEEVL